MRVRLLLAVLAALAVLGRPDLVRGERRIAVVVGSNQGFATDGPSLLYAEDDARALRKVLLQTGGFRDDDVLLVVGRGTDAIEAALTKATQLVAGAGEETLFLFYYSGHAGRQGLHPEAQNWSGERLHEMMGAIPATVSVGIIDGCHAGALVRGKGARSVAPFLAPVGEERGPAGSAWLLSAGTVEQAQETDEYRHSVFTFWLLSALQGAADASGDGLVTLAEVWEYVRSGTMLTSTRTGLPQRPVWDVRLRGNEDVTLASLHRRSEADSVVEFAAWGNYFLFTEKGRLVGEVHALLPGHWMALQPGRYLVRMLQGDDKLREGRIHLTAGDRVVIRPEAMTRIPYPRLARSKGRSNLVRHAPLALFHYHGATLSGFGPHLGGGVGWNVILGDWWVTPRLLAGASALELEGVAVEMAEVELAAVVGRGFDLGRVVLRPQLTAGSIYAHQKVTRDGGQSTSRNALGALLGAGAGATFVPGGKGVINLDLGGFLHGFRYQQPGGQTTFEWSPSLRLILGVGYVL